MTKDDLPFKVLTLLWELPEGATRWHIQQKFPAPVSNNVEGALKSLVARGLVLELSVEHGTDHAERDHKRFMVWRERSVA